MPASQHMYPSPLTYSSLVVIPKKFTKYSYAEAQIDASDSHWAFVSGSQQQPAAL